MARKPGSSCMQGPDPIEYCLARQAHFGNLDQSAVEFMDKKTKKKIQTLRVRVQKLRKQFAGAKEQMDDPEEFKVLEAELAKNEAELAALNES